MVLAESWFGSVKAAVKVGSMGHHAMLVLKTNHLSKDEPLVFSEKWLNEEMKSILGGCWITMRGKCGNTGVELVVIGYK